jgi:hypothetical protein
LHYFSLRGGGIQLSFIWILIKKINAQQIFFIGDKGFLKFIFGKGYIFQFGVFSHQSKVFGWDFKTGESGFGKFRNFFFDLFDALEIFGLLGVDRAENAGKQKEG